ncbi:Formate/nitrite transporter [Mycena metata]|uniref:Formate/nitrite transporter n=1 Tax=Mycena metata TaxID=1033252 RepID=A0AAD7JIT7_9AGAR|nr:Formate/nitrite transporter [Mycena metata]
MESAFSIQSTLKPDQVAVLMIEHAVVKHGTRYDKVFFKAVLAGIMLSFGGLMNELVQAGSTTLALENPALVKILGGFVFPTGFVLIVMLGLELLTSNMCVFPMAVVKKAIPWWSLPVNWIIVTFGNLCGSLFVAAILVHYSGIVSTEPYLSGFVAYAEKKAVTPEWHQIFLRGIGCNILVCLAVWLASGAKETTSKLIAIWIPIWIFVAVGFDHGNEYVLRATGDHVRRRRYIRKSLIATYLGNIVGAAIVWAPAVYFYLGDFSPAGLMEEAEEGKASSMDPNRRSSAATTLSTRKDGS